MVAGNIGFAELNVMTNVLLFQKEKDLELAARIGQQLLEQNGILEDKVAALQADNKAHVDSITQLKHDLQFKTELLEIYNESESPENSTARKSSKLACTRTYYMAAQCEIKGECFDFCVICL